MAWNDAPPTAAELKPRSWADEPPRPTELKALAQMSSAKPAEDSMGSKALQLGAGAAIGTAEAINPLNIPHNAEVLIRAPFQEVDQTKGFMQRLGERFQKAEANSVSPDLGVNKFIAPAIRAAADTVMSGEGPLGGKSFSENFKDEQRIQQAVQSGLYQTGNDIAQTAAGVYGLASLAKSAFNTVPKIAGFAETALSKAGTLSENTIKSLSNVAEDAVLNAKDPSKLVKAKTLLDKIAGGIPEEVTKAIFERTDRVRDLMKNPQNASVFQTVNDIRSHIDNTENLLTSSLHSFKDFLRTKNDIRLQNAPLLDLIDGFKGNMKLASGNVINQSDQRVLDGFKTLIQTRPRHRNFQETTSRQGTR
jgi:hypothetical protein